MNPTANDLWMIWNRGRANALVALLKGDTSVKEREGILFVAWSEAVGAMLAVMPGKDDWNDFTKGEKIGALAEKTFSFQNFEKSIFDLHFELSVKEYLPN